MSKALNDLRLYIGCASIPNEALDDQGRVQLREATGRLLQINAQGMLGLMVDFSRSGLQPIKPHQPIQVREPPPGRNETWLKRFKK